MIKPLFCYDITVDRKNDGRTGQAFLTRRVDDALKQEMDERSAALTEALFKSVLTPCHIAGAILCLIGVTVLAAALREAAPLWLPIGSGVTVLAGLVLLALGFRRQKQDGEFDRFLEEGTAVAERAAAALGEPEDAILLDILTRRYRVKGENIIVNPFEETDFENDPFCAFVDGRALCLTDNGERYDIPLDEIGDIRRIERKITISGWYKDGSPTEEPYDRYVLRAGNNDTQVRLPYYYAISIRHGGEQYELYLPPYELSTFGTLTGAVIPAE